MVPESFFPMVHSELLKRPLYGNLQESHTTFEYSNLCNKINVHTQKTTVEMTKTHTFCLQNIFVSVLASEVDGF